jgi:hypothetical protein
MKTNLASIGPRQWRRMSRTQRFLYTVLTQCNIRPKLKAADLDMASTNFPVWIDLENPYNEKHPQTLFQIAENHARLVGECTTHNTSELFYAILAGNDVQHELDSLDWLDDDAFEE